jgi:preprotein translocase subunit SecG
MQNVLLVIHMLACVALVIAVLLQRSEGGALGMGGGGTGGFISGRGAASVLVRTTMILAGVFIVTSIVMTRLNAEMQKAPTAIERELENRQGNGFDPLANPAAPKPTTPAPATTTSPLIVTPDPLAPVSPAITPPATPATQTPAATPAPAPKPATPPASNTATPPATQPATPAPQPATPPQNNGATPQ